jgi:hypothetical protein
VEIPETVPTSKKEKSISQPVKFNKDEANKEIFKRTGLSASHPKFAKLGKNKRLK